jgi:hypothetical protein
MRRHRFIGALAAIAISTADAAESQHCAPAEIVLWGDGRHDDTAALNAWWHGAEAVWADSGAAVGAVIAGRSFRLSAAIYVPGGSGRRLDNFHLLWPERGEVVAGGTIAAGTDPDSAPLLSGVNIQGGDPGEGKPLDLPDPVPALPNTATSCATS